jgi:hypothetical protein
MAHDLKIKRFLITLTIAVALTCASLAYQRMGPETGAYGNMCADQPEGLCIGRLLGAGLPLQYVIDQPGVSIVYQLGIEDKFRIGAFLLDILFYELSLYAGLWLIKRFRQGKKKQA